MNSNNLHPLLEKQLSLLPEGLRAHEAMNGFIIGVQQLIEKHENERELIEHAHRISGMEFTELNRKLREAAERLELATKATQIGVWEWNSFTGKIIWDDYMYEIFGVDDREAFGNISANWHTLTHPDDKAFINERIAEISSGTTGGTLEFRIFRANDKAERIIFANVLIKRDAKQQPLKIVGVCMDVTDARTSEKEKANLLADILTQNRQLEDFAFVISHRLRSHSSKLSSVANVFSNKDADESLRKLLIEEVKKEAQLLDETLKELTEIVGITKSNTSVFESLNLRHVIHEALIKLQHEIVKFKVEVMLDVDETLVVSGVKTYLNNVIFQLTDNAIKFRKPDGHLKIQIKSSAERDKVKLFVSDNGMGIDMERHQNKLFGLYRKFHTHIDGKGIGLHLAKKQMEWMNGSIEITSNLNIGTTVELTLNKA